MPSSVQPIHAPQNPPTCWLVSQSAALGSGPYLLGPVVPGKKPKRRNTTRFTTGIRRVSVIQPDRPVSCQRLTQIASWIQTEGIHTKIRNASRKSLCPLRILSNSRARLSTHSATIPPQNVRRAVLPRNESWVSAIGMSVFRSPNERSRASVVVFRDSWKSHCLVGHGVLLAVRPSAD